MYIYIYIYMYIYIYIYIYVVEILIEARAEMLLDDPGNFMPPSKSNTRNRKVSV